MWRTSLSICGLLWCFPAIAETLNVMDEFNKCRAHPLSDFGAGDAKICKVILQVKGGANAKSVQRAQPQPPAIEAAATPPPPPPPPANACDQRIFLRADPIDNLNFISLPCLPISPKESD
jgi:hypothetical protein